MKKALLSGFLIFWQLISLCQNLDLVVTSNRDSIACNIDSISGSTIYLQIIPQKGSAWIQTVYDSTEVVMIQYDCIDPSKYSSSRINAIAKPAYSKKFPNKATLEKASNDELNFYLGKAKKTKKTGAIMSISGPLAAAAGYGLMYASFSLSGDEPGFVFGTFLFFGGLASTLIGIPVLITGTSRVEKISNIKFQKSDGVAMNICPSVNYNYQNQNYQPGVTLSIRF